MFRRRLFPVDRVNINKKLICPAVRKKQPRLNDSDWIWPARQGRWKDAAENAEEDPWKPHDTRTTDWRPAMATRIIGEHEGRINILETTEMKLIRDLLFYILVVLVQVLYCTCVQEIKCASTQPGWPPQQPIVRLTGQTDRPGVHKCAHLHREPSLQGRSLAAPSSLLFFSLRMQVMLWLQNALFIQNCNVAGWVFCLFQPAARKVSNFRQYGFKDLPESHFSFLFIIHEIQSIHHDM
jgi:hypothetical protein